MASKNQKTNEAPKVEETQKVEETAKTDEAPKPDEAPKEAPKESPTKHTHIRATAIGRCRNVGPKFLGGTPVEICIADLRRGELKLFTKDPTVKCEFFTPKDKG